MRRNGTEGSEGHQAIIRVYTVGICKDNGGRTAVFICVCLAIKSLSVATFA